MNELHKLFKNIGDIDPPERLEKVILRKISLEKEKQIRQKLAFSYIGLAGSALASVYTWLVFGNSLLQSDFWTLAKLIFSDTQLVLQNWNDFAFSLMETLPIFGMIAILAPVFALFLLTSQYLKTVGNNHYKYI